MLRVVQFRRRSVCHPGQRRGGVGALDGEGQPLSFRCGGLLARAAQHETDHLHGILFIDRMEKKVRTALDKAVKALAQQTREAAKAP